MAAGAVLMSPTRNEPALECNLPELHRSDHDLLTSHQGLTKADPEQRTLPIVNFQVPEFSGCYGSKSR